MKSEQVASLARVLTHSLARSLTCSQAHEVMWVLMPHFQADLNYSARGERKDAEEDHPQKAASDFDA